MPKCSSFLTVTLVLFAVCSPSATAQTQTTVSVILTQPYTDTGLQVTQGQTITVSASGDMDWCTGHCPAGQTPPATPAGMPWNTFQTACTDIGEQFIAPGLPVWSLLGKIGNGQPFEVGTALTFTAASSGEFYLGVNDCYYPDNTGSWVADITISSTNCTQSATVDSTKVHINTDPNNQFSATGDFSRLTLWPGNSLLGHAFHPWGMEISVDTDAVSYSGTSPPNVTYNYIQVLNQWNGNSVYHDFRGNSFDEWYAISEDPKGQHSPPFVDSYNYVPPFPYYPNVLAPFPNNSPLTGIFLGDSPAVSAPLVDQSGRLLTEMHYTKQFITYFGCHTPEDDNLPLSDPNHFLRTLAIVEWTVTYSGTVGRRCFLGSCANRPAFTPDSSAGVNLDSVDIFNGTALAEPPTVSPPVANNETRYQWSQP